MSQDFMETTHDKFVFRVKKGYLSHPGECWIREDGDLITVGITDFLQKTAGDVAFLELLEVGTEVAQGGEAGIVETIKTTVTIISPAGGVIQELNTTLEENPQQINTDPYGEGWLFRLAPTNWDADKNNLIDAEKYFPIMEEKIKKELEK
jgi:glycine cleavage system H protein